MNALVYLALRDLAEKQRQGASVDAEVFEVTERFWCERCKTHRVRWHGALCPGCEAR